MLVHGGEKNAIPSKIRVWQLFLLIDLFISFFLLFYFFFHPRLVHFYYRHILYVKSITLSQDQLKRKLNYIIPQAISCVDEFVLARASVTPVYVRTFKQ